MKRYILALVMLLGLVGSYNASAQFRYGPMLGLTFSDLKFKQDLITVDKGTGFSAGLATELMFPGIGFGMSSGIFYEMRGAMLHLGEKKVWASQGYGNERTYLHYIEIPIHLRFKWTRMAGVEDYWAPFVYGGPTFAILAGHSDIKALKYAYGEVGLTVGGGFELFKRWQIQCSYTWGVTYAEKTKLLDDFSAKNRTLDVRVAYFF